MTDVYCNLVPTQNNLKTLIFKISDKIFNIDQYTSLCANNIIDIITSATYHNIQYIPKQLYIQTCNVILLHITCLEILLAANRNSNLFIINNLQHYLYFTTNFRIKIQEFIRCFLYQEFDRVPYLLYTHILCYSYSLLNIIRGFAKINNI